jgi:uncharacterized protein (DUF736 family)
MAYEQKDNDGVLFPNKERRGEKDPNARGSGIVNGQEVWIAAWTNTSKSGDKYQSLKFTPKNENNTRSPPKSAPKPEADFGDDIPF